MSPEYERSCFGHRRAGAGGLLDITYRAYERFKR